MLRIYGYSDDLLVIDDRDEIDCFDDEVTVWFTDGTIIKAGYGKDHKGIWWIHVENVGTATQSLRPCDDEEADIYSDIFEIDAEVLDYCVGKVIEDVQALKALFREVKKNYPIGYIEQAYREVFNED